MQNLIELIAKTFYLKLIGRLSA